MPCIFVKCKFLFFLVNEGQFLNVCVICYFNINSNIVIKDYTLCVVMICFF